MLRKTLHLQVQTIVGLLTACAIGVLCNCLASSPGPKRPGAHGLRMHQNISKTCIKLTVTYHMAIGCSVQTNDLVDKSSNKFPFCSLPSIQQNINPLCQAQYEPDCNTSKYDYGNIATMYPDSGYKLMVCSWSVPGPFLGLGMMLPIVVSWPILNLPP